MTGALLGHVVNAIRTGIEDAILSVDYSGLKDGKVEVRLGNGDIYEVQVRKIREGWGEKSGS